MIEKVVVTGERQSDVYLRESTDEDEDHALEEIKKLNLTHEDHLWVAEKLKPPQRWYNEE
jgi:hypothetical protein